MKIVLASSNQGKLKELQQILAPLGYHIQPQHEHNVPDADETGLTFVENAILKARNACHHTGLAAISDDSGIEVDALNGAPGIYSARYAGINANDAANNALLIEQLKKQGNGPFSARYQCVIVYMRHATDPTPIICQGTWEGEIQFTPAGSNGFGYDPHFYVPEKKQTAAELVDEVKHAMSHRGKALTQLITALKNR